MQLKKGLLLLIGCMVVSGFNAAREQSTASQQNDDSGPRRYYYTSALYWDSAEGFCDSFGHQTLCTFDQLCPTINGARQFIHDVIPGDHWVAVKGRDWVEIGDYHSAPCFLHSWRWSPNPNWGENTVSYSFKGYVYCCKDTSPDELPAVSYRYIGKTATYESSKDHCRQQKRRLCNSSEICVKSKPVYGIVKGNIWVAINGQFNEWIQIGNAYEHTCFHHGPRFGQPTWGTRTDGSDIDWVGYVYCCK